MSSQEGGLSEIVNATNFYHITGAGSGVLAWVFQNLYSKKPLGSRIPLCVALVGAGLVGGQILTNRVRKIAKQSDLAILDYVKRHPEDFPELNAPKYKDVLLAWHPQR